MEGGAVAAWLVFFRSVTAPSQLESQVRRRRLGAALQKGLQWCENDMPQGRAIYEITHGRKRFTHSLQKSAFICSARSSTGKDTMLCAVMLLNVKG